jgi:xanthine dehydrogenase YagS FAD-binding subunit
MKAFEYAAPRRETEVCELLASADGAAEIIAGGTDVVGLMKKMLVTPSRVVNIKEVASLGGISADSTGVTIGATTTLDELLESPHLDAFPAVKQVIRNISSPQLQQQGTLGGELCQRPRCWYYRNGYGLLEAAGLIERGENRYHAIFGNEGLAKFVAPSRLAPALIALGAQLRIVGNGSEARIPVEALYRTPQVSAERELVLDPDQLVTHVHVPFGAGPMKAGPKGKLANASYEVRHGEGPDYPLVACSAALEITGGVVTNAQIVLGQVAPTPWISAPAAEALLGKPVNAATAREAGEAAVAWATPLSDNGYKVHLAKVAVERAIRLAAGLPSGGF